MLSRLLRFGPREVYRPFLTPIRRSFAKPAKSQKDKLKIIRNGDIKFPKLRVVYTEESTSEKKWEIMDLSQALSFAKKVQLDLILVNPSTDPPVCKLDDVGDIITKQRQKKKEKRVSQKARTLKEMYFKGGIDQNDLNTKTNKVKSFLLDGHQVKIVVVAKKITLNKNPYAVDETILKIIDAVEEYAASAQPPNVASPFRQDFLLNPKSGAELEHLKNKMQQEKE